MSLPGDASSAPDLAPGDDSSDWVAELQRLLQALDHLHRDPDGRFDDDTQRAVEEFQTAAGLPVDGTVRHDTWTALFAAAPAEQYGAVEPAFGDEPAGHGSEDGHWVWDGERWVSAGDGGTDSAAREPSPGDGQLSEDRQWRWDGAEWQPANQ
jgi:peptidoglycan hydrolase-like protein with peptidoglycan-binding domain